ncbi:MAG: HAD-IB family phosphatase [Methylococcaceae bacterium]|nr:HAD-IB family phosphatase [Methylococcaceae bacterium]
MSFEIICFDCDSTLSRIEGIDECAKAVGLGEEMAKLTNAAMNGELALEAVYQKRLDLIRPNKQAIDSLADLYISEMVEGVSEVFKTLQDNGKQIHIISGGLRQAILPLAALLNIPENQVHAVDVLFNADGSYQDFNQDSPLARTGGKAEICKQISSHPENMALIGDGKTDLEAQQVGVKVIGFGGVARRDIVEQQADFYVTDSSLTAVLKHLL